MLYEITSVDNFLRRSRGLVILPDAETGVEAKFLCHLSASVFVPSGDLGTRICPLVRADLRTIGDYRSTGALLQQLWTERGS